MSARPPQPIKAGKDQEAYVVQIAGDKRPAQAAGGRRSGLRANARAIACMLLARGVAAPPHAWLAAGGARR